MAPKSVTGEGYVIEDEADNAVVPSDARDRLFGCASQVSKATNSLHRDDADE